MLGSRDQLVQHQNRAPRGGPDLNQILIPFRVVDENPVFEYLIILAKNKSIFLPCWSSMDTSSNYEFSSLLMIFGFIASMMATLGVSLVPSFTIMMICSSFAFSMNSSNLFQQEYIKVHLVFKGQDFCSLLTPFCFCKKR